MSACIQNIHQGITSLQSIMSNILTSLTIRTRVPFEFADMEQGLEPPTPSHISTVSVATTPLRSIKVDTPCAPVKANRPWVIPRSHPDSPTVSSKRQLVF